MINTKHLLKVMAIWVSIVYVICYAGVAIFPQSRELFMKYSLHADTSITSNYFGVGYFISGLVIWNIVAMISTWLFAVLFNKIKISF